MKASLANQVVKHQLSKNLQSAAESAQNTLNMNNQQSGSKTGKARPSVMQIGDTKRKLDYKYDPEYRSIEVWNQKLENMLTILQAADMTSKSH